MAEPETAKPINIVRENNPFDVSDVSDKLVVVPVAPAKNIHTSDPILRVDDNDNQRKKATEFNDSMLQRRNEQKQREAEAEASKKRAIPIVKALKPTYESVSETDKVTFLTELSELFKEKSQAKKATYNKKYVLDSDVIKHYKTLSDQLQYSIPLLRNGNMLRSSINSHPKLFVVFTDTKEKQKRLNEINAKKDKKTPVEIRESLDINNQLKQTDSLTNYNYMIDILKKNEKLKSFTDFLKKKSKTNVLYQRLLFLIIMQGYNNDPVDDTSIYNLTAAFNGTYVSRQTPASDGGKRKTKKNKKNKITSKKIRSIKKSKKNKTRRR